MDTSTPSLRLYRQLHEMANTFSIHPEWIGGNVALKWTALYDEWATTMAPSSMYQIHSVIAAWVAHWPRLPSDISPLSREGLTHYIEHMEAQGFSPKLMYTRLDYVKRLFSAIDASESSAALFRQMKTYREGARQRPRECRTLIHEELDAILALIDLDIPLHVQDACMLLVLYECAARPYEIFGTCNRGCWTVDPIAVSDLTLHPDDTGILRIRSHRGTRTRMVQLSQRCGRLLRRWLEMTGIEYGPLFRLFRQGSSDRIATRPLSRLVARKHLVKWVRYAGFVQDGISLESPRMGKLVDDIRANRVANSRLIKICQRSVVSSLDATPHTQDIGDPSIAAAAMRTHPRDRRKPPPGTAQLLFKF